MAPTLVSGSESESESESESNVTVRTVTTADQPSFSGCSGSTELISETSYDNAGDQNTPARNEADAAVVPVIDETSSCPAQPESPGNPPDFSKSSSDASVSVSQGPVISDSHNNQNNVVTRSENPSVTPNHTIPERQRSSNRGRGGGGAGPVQLRFCSCLPPLPPPFPQFDMPCALFAGLMPPYFFPLEPPYRGHNWEARPIGGFVSPSRSVSHQNSSHCGNCGCGQHRDWCSARSSNARDVNGHRQIAQPRGFVPSSPPPPPVPCPFATPHSMGPFRNSMGFETIKQFSYAPRLHWDFYVPRFPPHAPWPQPMICPVHDDTFPTPHARPISLPVQDVPLPAKIVKQIEYYFSEANLQNDYFLKSKMDDNGWVRIDLVAGFPMVKKLTDDIKLIADSLGASSVVEVEHDRIRRRNDWSRWIRTPGQFPNNVGLSHDTITTSLQQVMLDEATTSQSSVMDMADSSTDVVSG